MEKQSKSLSGVYSTFKDTFTQNVLLPIGDGLSKSIKPALISLTEIGESIGGLTTKSDRLRSSLEKEHTTISILVNRITDQNTSNTIRKELIKQLQQEYPAFLGNLKAETATNTQLRDRLQEVNKGYMLKVIALEASKKVEVALQNEAAAQEYVGKAVSERAERTLQANDRLHNTELTHRQKIEELNKQKMGLPWYSFIERDRINQLIHDLGRDETDLSPILSRASNAVKEEQKRRDAIIEEVKKSNPTWAKEIDEMLNPAVFVLL